MLVQSSDYNAIHYVSHFNTESTWGRHIHDSHTSYATVITRQHPSDDAHLSDISPFKLIESEIGGKVERCSVVKMSSLFVCTSTEVSCDLWLT